jgi:DNA-binding transcriptional ArsR family regulator
MDSDRNLDGSAPGAPSAREPLTAQIIELTVERLRVVAEANRIALLEALSEGEAGVQELAERVGIPYQNTSHHLILLRQAGILTRRRLGKAYLYAIEDWSAWWVVGQIAGSMRSSPARESKPAPSSHAVTAVDL